MTTDPAFSDPSARWWLARPGQQPLGPFGWNDLVAKLRSAGGVGDWLACREGSTEWMRLADDHAVVNAVGATGASAPPPPPSGGSSAATPPTFPTQSPPSAPPSFSNTTAIDPSDRTMAVLLHLSSFGGIIIPGLGIVLPLVLWLTNRQRPALDAVGKEVMNYTIVVLIAAVVCVVLVLCLIGYLLLLALGVATIVLPIIAAVKASNGEFFRYPLPFRIIR